ncbi:protein-tyrosine phosphatase-like protein [Gilbertella persicaria]|uniref:protein-tyrosine phosphatase-like protein n=1 Tax=Gilbertella persicaria TaxID=101096 RepID=UPI002220D633|nr:protein-tyrosine phosphatase-like protein [Gilbertella persicaria]KAI8057560.1 protein-tyrosine phosphatase-like protein [Gilbertella persicaria]
MYSRSSPYPNNGGVRSLINPPTFIEYNQLRFLIVDAPSSNNLPLYINEFERWHVTDVVRCCEATYPKEPLNEKGIQVHDFVFVDGEAPPTPIVDAWLQLIEARFSKQQPSSDEKLSCIAIHCVAGLGRAPVLVAIALIEEDMPALDAVAYIRERRRGAINKKQLKYIESYKPRSKSQCIIM